MSFKQVEDILKKTLTKRRPEKKLSHCVFLQERPSVPDLRLQNTEIATIAPGKRVAQRLREYTASGHKIWEFPQADAHGGFCVPVY